MVLNQRVPPALEPRRQAPQRGPHKSSFNFSEVDKPLFKELAALTKAGFRSYKEQGFV